MARPRVILAIETSNPSSWMEGQASRPGVALGRLRAGGALELLGVRALDPTRPHDDELMPEIDGVLRSVSLRSRDLTDVAVSVGPGGYTAVRLAVTTAKLIAEGTGAMAVPVPSSLVAAWGIAPTLGARGIARFAVAISSKGETTFLTGFELMTNGVRSLGVGSVIRGAELRTVMKALGATALVGDRFLPAGVVQSAGEIGLEIIAPEFDPVACLHASLELEAVEPAALVPTYAREPEAVTKWRELGKGRSDKGTTSL